MNKHTTFYQQLSKIGAVAITIGLLSLTGLGLGLTQAQEEPTPLPPPPTSTPVPQLTESIPAVGEGAVEISNDLTDELGGPVNIFDLSFVADRFGSSNPAADVNGDGQVDILDIAVLAGRYGEPEPDAGVLSSPVATPMPMPLVESGEAEADFGAVLQDVELAVGDIESQAYYVWRPLKIGLGIDRVFTWDYFDGQTNTPPDFYAVATVDGSTAGTTAVANSRDIYPYWRLGWWQYQQFPKFNYYDPVGDNYYIPVTLEIRDDDGRICYGYLGCRPAYDTADISQTLSNRVKQLRFYPSSCKVIDEAGLITQGTYFDSSQNRCRVFLYTAGSEWPRAAVNYYIDALWE